MATDPLVYGRGFVLISGLEL